MSRGVPSSAGDGDTVQLPSRDELEAVARDVLDADTYAYYASGAGDERSVHDNERAWREWYLRPRVLLDVRALDTRTSVLGTSLSMPLLLAPCAFNGWAHPDGEAAVVRAAHRAGIVPIVSQSATLPFDEVARASDGPIWFQCYPGADADVSDRVLAGVVGAGCRAIVVTADAPVGGIRTRGMSRFAASADAGAFTTGGNASLWPGLDWAAVARIRRRIEVPVVVKGVLHPGDVERAVEHGVDAVIVSNHGGRQLEGVVPTAVALPGIVDAAADRIPVLVDGGVRDGRDVLRALALGAGAVAIGRRTCGRSRSAARPACSRWSSGSAPSCTTRWR